MSLALFCRSSRKLQFVTSEQTSLLFFSRIDLSFRAVVAIFSFFYFERRAAFLRRRRSSLLAALERRGRSAATTSRSVFSEAAKTVQFSNPDVWNRSLTQALDRCSVVASVGRRKSELQLSASTFQSTVRKTLSRCSAHTHSHRYVCTWPECAAGLSRSYQEQKKYMQNR